MNRGLTRQDKEALVRRLLQMLFLIGLQGLALFIAAGSLAWAAAWIYIGLYTGLAVVGAVVLLPAHSDLLVERSRGAAGGKRWDFWVTRLLFVTTLGILGTAGLDKRLSWPPNLPLLAQVLGTLVFVAGYLLMLWAMAVNAFFSQTVRIQTERGHTLVTDGPYAYVRHPGYVGMLAITLGACFLLGSLWALLAWLPYVVLIIVRTRLEDRTLRAELPGYLDYVERTRFRLIPSSW